MRKIREIINHCSATVEGQHVTVETITRWHKRRNPPFRTIGYHFVIYLDGTIHEGRPVSETGAHVSGRNRDTIGICYIGGYDKNKRPKDTRTPAQKAALLSLHRRLLKEYPAIEEISGHREYANKACPCFDARAEYQHLLENRNQRKKAAESGKARNEPIAREPRQTPPRTKNGRGKCVPWWKRIISGGQLK